MLRMKNVTKRYPGGFCLRRVSLRVAVGERVALSGVAGAGKSSVLALAAGAVSPDGGHVLVAGKPVARTPSVRASLGYVPSGYRVDSAIPVRSYLALCSRLRGQAWLGVGEAVDRALRWWQLGEVAHRVAGELSSGQQLRLALAGATVHGPRLLLLDEPALAETDIEILRSALAALGTISLVVASRRRALLQQLCGREVVFAGGSVIDEVDWTAPSGKVVEVELVGPEDELDGVLSQVMGVLDYERLALGSGAHRVRVTVDPGTDIEEAFGRLALVKGWVVKRLFARPAGEHEAGGASP